MYMYLHPNEGGTAGHGCGITRRSSMTGYCCSFGHPEYAGQQGSQGNPHCSTPVYHTLP